MTERLTTAGPEEVADEYAAALAEAARARNPDRQEYLRGVIATLDRVWNGSDVPPVDTAAPSTDSGGRVERH